MGSTEKKQFVIVGLHSWDLDIGSNAKDLAVELSKDNKVLYINRPITRKMQFQSRKDDLIKNRLEIIKGNQPDIYQLSDNLWIFYPRIVIESINWINVSWLFNYLNKINNKRIGVEALRAIKALGLRDFILINDNDFINYIDFHKYVDPKVSIYYLRDYLLYQNFFSKYAELEEQVMFQSDLVLTNSEYLREYAEKYNDNSYFIGQGCDFSMYSNEKYVVPEDLKHIKKPVVGYTGAILADRLDYDLIKFLALNNKDYSYVLVGPEDEYFQKSDLHQLDNVFFLGGKKPEEIPSYIAHFDVCINPQKLNELTIGNYPRKIDEYLALGKPVVAIETKAMAYFKDYVYLAKDEIEFSKMIKDALAHNNLYIQERIKFATGHTWEKCVDHIYQYL